jgi:hypothetical protein
MNDVYPDRNGNVYPGDMLLKLNGFRVHLNAMLTETKHRTQERKWAHRKMWKKAKRFNHISYEVPSRQIIKTDGKLFMHPAMWKEIEAANNKQPTFSMGMSHASESAKPQNHQRITSDAMYQVEINPANLGLFRP